MTLSPRSLLWRNFLLFALLLICSALIVLTITRLNEREPRAKQIAQQAASIVNLSRTALIAVPRENRRFLLTELHRQEGIRIYPAAADDAPGRQPQRAFGKMLAREIMQRLGPETRVEFGRRGLPGLWVSFAIEDDTYWVAMPRVPIERTLPKQLIAWVGASLVLALFGAWFIAWRINRPLKALAANAQSIGRGGQPAPLAEYGAEEIRSLIRSFNRMNQDLAQLNQERTVMLAGISHDLRTPLTRMRLEVELGELPEEARANMVDDLELMDRIVAQFLDYARTDPTRPKARIDVAELVEHAIEASRLQRDATVRIERQIETGVYVHGLAVELARALANLLTNADRYGRDPETGQLDLTVRLRRSAHDAVIEIADRGPGVEADRREQLLRPFVRGDSARAGVTGTGLGLAIVARIARMHGGGFQLLGHSPRGLCATLSLPLFH